MLAAAAAAVRRCLMGVLPGLGVRGGPPGQIWGSMIINLSRLKSCMLVKCQELISRYYLCELKVRKFQK